MLLHTTKGMGVSFMEKRPRVARQGPQRMNNTSRRCRELQSDYDQLEKEYAQWLKLMKIATRDSYGKALVALADAGHDEVVVFRRRPFGFHQNLPVPEGLPETLFLTAASPSPT